MKELSVLQCLELLAIVLALSPLIVAYLHVLVGLSWRADFLLGRLDSVLGLTRHERVGLYCQVIELFNHVKTFATPRKFKQMQDLRRGMHEPEKDPVTLQIYGSSDDPQAKRRNWITRYERLRDSLRYFLPAFFLVCVYLIGFQLILLRHEFGTLPPVKTASQQKADTNTPPPPNPAAPVPTGGGAAGTSVAIPVAANPAAKPGDATQPKPAEAAKQQPPPAPKADDANPPECKLRLDPCSNPTPTENIVNWWKAIPADKIDYLIYAFLGSFVFNTGIMVRRIFVWDISGQMFWWAAYRVVLSLGLAEVVNFSTNKIEPHMYFLIATASVSILDSSIRSLRAKLFQSDAVPKQNELSLQLIQGIDYWKEQRLMEEGIESIQNLATADFVLLALHTRTPLFTIMDWVDQAVFVQRFPSKAAKLTEAGLPVSAVKLTWGWQPENRDIPIRPASIPPANGGQVDPNQPPTTWKYEDYLHQVAEALGTKEEALVRTLEAWSNDNQVQLLTLFWRADLGMDKKPKDA